MKKRSLLVLLVLLATVLVFSITACGVTTGENKEQIQQSDNNDTITEVDWPTAPVNVILHASAGGDTDFNARTFATYFEEITGQPLIVTNMPGASGVAATEDVRQSNPDGYKALFTHTGPLIVNYVSGLIDYKYDEFDVSTIPAIDGGTVLVASTQSGLTSMNDVIERSKSNPESIIFGTEFGNYSHLQVLQIEKLSDIQFKLADIGSTADKVTNLLGGRIDIAAITYGSVKDYIETGEMIALAQFNAEPNQYLGDVPTLKSIGVDMVMDKPYIIAFPKGTDPAIIKKMSDIAIKIGQNPEYQAKLKDGFNQEVKVLETQDAIKYLDDILEDYMQYSDILKSAN